MKVPLREGEKVRQELAGKDLLDRSLRPKALEGCLLIPVLAPGPGNLRCTFHSLPPQEELPRHELVGGIAIMPERDVGAAEFLLRARPVIHTVLFPESEVEGEFRTRSFEVLAGEPTTKTTVTEYGHRFVIDLSAAYFSARLATERQRVLGQVAPGESVLDMFTGVGPFAITLADVASFVVASDLNPGAVLLLLENIRLNRVKNVLPACADAARLDRVLHWKFDRVVMNYPLDPVPFLPHAMRLCRPGGWIHCYMLQSEEGALLPSLHDYPVASCTEHMVRSYSPGKWHAVYDIRLE
ncbi:tRNA (guanine37-N1)-methyltransferase [Methanolinea mesophila]|uniref:class I SAM-dependent methyltransferase n=1 Tax=Methanolinea mesophila TaxID=547055 RepID=UPI001FD73FDE|nr:class I SAM-dependent methyltransferase family protein [Methanolinea mesophila]MBP1928693.1 tRNA (guanine37-N1)-methyltransferase [Methanolinea mesophila]